MVSSRAVRCIKVLTGLRLSSTRGRTTGGSVRDVLSCVSGLGRLSASGIRPVSRMFPMRGIFQRSIIRGNSNKRSALTGTPRHHSHTFMIPGAMRWKKTTVGLLSLATMRLKGGVGTRRIAIRRTAETTLSTVHTGRGSVGDFIAMSRRSTVVHTGRMRGVVSSKALAKPLTNIPITVGSGVYAGKVLAAYDSGVLCGFVPACATRTIVGLRGTNTIVLKGAGVSRFTVKDAARASTCKRAGGP